MDLKWQVAMISMRMKKFYKKTGRKLQFDAKEPNGRRAGKQEDSKALVNIDGEGVDWTSHSKKEEDYALMACNSSGSDTEVTSCLNECKESYAKLKNLYDAQREQLSDASIEIKEYTHGLKKVEAQLVAHQQGQLWYEEKIRFMKIDLDDKTDVLTYHKKLLAEAQKEKEDLQAKVEKWHNSSKNLGKLLNTQMSANDKFGLGYGDHRYDGILSYENEVLQSVFMSKEILTRTSKITINTARASGTNNVSTVRHNFNRQAVPTNVAMKVNTVKPIVNRGRPATVFHKTHSPYSRPFNNITTLRINFSKQKVNTAEVNAVSAVGGKKETAVKPLAGCIWRKQRQHWHKVSKYNGGSNYPHKALQNKEIVYSGCSRHMTGNKAYLAEYQDFNGGPVVKNPVYHSKTKHIAIRHYFIRDAYEKKLIQHLDHSDVFHGVISVLESHWEELKMDSTAIELVKGNLVRGLPSKIFQNDHTCVACQKGKQHKASCKAKSVNSISHSLQLLHMDLFGPTSDETSGILKDFIRQIENQLNQKVKTIRCDNGTEFKNKDVIEFCGSKGIKREYSNARTPQQNGVAERKNRTLIEAARTMLADSFLPNTFWAEAVSTACYVLNRNQANKHAGPQEANPNAGTEDIINAGDSEKEDESAQDCFVLPIWSSYSSKIRDLGAEELKRHRKSIDNNAAEDIRKDIPVSTASPYDGLSLSDPTNPEQDDSEIPPLEDIYQNPTDGIFTNSSYDDEGAVADFTNLETVVNVSPIPTSRINSFHPSALILGDPNSAVQTRSKVNKSSGAHAFVSYVQKQRRNNHKDFQHCLFACFLSQNEPKKISEALEDESWVDAMQEELLQFKIQKVWILVDLPYGKKAIGTKWVYRNKKDERGVVVRNKARLVAQGHRQEEGIDYDEVTPSPPIMCCKRFLDSTDSAELVSMGKVVIDIETCRKITPRVQKFKLKWFLEVRRSSIHHAITGKHFLGKVTSLFASMLVQPTEDEGAPLERPSEVQPTPSHPHTSEAPVEPQTDPSPRPLPSTTILDFISESSGGNHGGFRSSQGNSKIKGTDQEAQKASQTCSNIPQSIDKECILEAQIGRKEILKETMDAKRVCIQTGEEVCQRLVDVKIWWCNQRDVVDEEKENAEDVLSTEDALSTAQQKVSTDKEKVSTDRPIVSTDGSKVSTDKEKDSTDEQNEGTDDQAKGTDDHTEGGWATQTTQTPTSTIFGDDETIAQVLLNMSQAKAVSREKEKGVEFKDIEETKRPRPTSTRSLLTLKPLPKIDPKDKGKKKIEEEDESESESDGIPEAEKKFQTNLLVMKKIASEGTREWDGEGVKEKD
ncbi:putative ribonuclease H-like domain-containing protein [Tanacetum coccineum]